MLDRAAIIEIFLTRNGWAESTRQLIAGDGSARVYHRLNTGQRNAILMDAPPAKGESTDRFAGIASWLSSQGYSAPKVLAEDHSNGLLIVEDFGSETIAERLHRRPEDEDEMAFVVVDLLADLQRRTPPKGLGSLDTAGLARLVRDVVPWIRVGLGMPDAAHTDAIPDLIADAHSRTDRTARVVSMRDFHAGNLIWLPDRVGISRIGLLDFQDAVTADAAYDLVSYLQDARRAVPLATESAAITRFCNASGIADETAFRAIYAVLGVQRALRIIGVFFRLVLRDGKPRYLDYLPHTFNTVFRNLEHPMLAELAEPLRTVLARPDAAIYDRARTLCGSIQTP